MPFRNYHALLIGVGDYQHGARWPDLCRIDPKRVALFIDACYAGAIVWESAAAPHLNGKRGLFVGGSTCLALEDPVFKLRRPRRSGPVPSAAWS